MSDVVWCDPPAAKPGAPGVWKARLAPLVDRPREWARVDLYWSESRGRGVVKDLRRRRLAVPVGEWEFRCSRIGDNTWGVWARYLGPEESV